MEAGKTPTPPPTNSAGGDPLSGEDVRRATFPQALRGYDRQAVHDMLDRVADWMEGKAGAVSSATPAMRDELAKVGERTAGILTAADEAASNLREEATEYADRLRADTEDESRKARLNASQKMDEMVAAAEAKSQKIIDDAIARRRQLNVAISSLVDRRDEIAADATRLAEELLGAVEAIRSTDHGSDDVGPMAAPAEALSEEDVPEDPAQEPPAEEETHVHPGPDSEETEIFEDDIPDARRPATLLVDPDEDD